MTDNFNSNPANLGKLVDQYDEQVSANLLIASKGSHRALRLLVPPLAKMFIDGVLIGRALSGTLYYNSSKDLEGDNNHYFVQEVLKNDKYRVYIFFFKQPLHPMPSNPTGPPGINIPLPLPYATFMAPDLNRHIHANQLHHFSGNGKWTEFNWGSSSTKITSLPPLNDITISLPAVHITGKIHTEHHPHLHHSPHPFAAQGTIYHRDYQSLEATERALYSPDSIVFYTKDGEESDHSDQAAFFVPAIDSTLPAGHGWFTGIKWENQVE